jgi:DnaJ-class molecular chaperone
MTMNTTSIYSDLNIREGASINEIKAAFRNMAKAYHPDSAGTEKANVEKFIKAQSAYQKLMKTAMAHNAARRAAQADAKEETVAANWRFTSRREVGLDVYFSLSVLRPAAGGTKVVLPWQAQEACPRCLGHGQTLGRVGNIYRPATCSKCGGHGTVARETKLEVAITPEMVGQKNIRLRKAGLYNAKTAERGDLILNINWVEEFPRHN